MAKISVNFVKSPLNAYDAAPAIKFNEQLIIYNESTNEAKKSAALVAMENSLAILKTKDPEKYLEFKRASI